MKKMLEKGLAFTLLIFLTPLLALISGLILLFQGRPILFSQTRVGKNCKTFKIYKFRTMRPKIVGDGLGDDDLARVTALGNILRRTSLDELPEIINIIRGEMCFVGPRPLLFEYLEHYTIEQNRRHEVLPGITGLAQIKGRNKLSWRNKFKYDVFYVDNKSICFDLRILMLTLGTLVNRDVNSDEKVTAKRFALK